MSMLKYRYRINNKLWYSVIISILLHYTTIMLFCFNKKIIDQKVIDLESSKVNLIMVDNRCIDEKYLQNIDIPKEKIKITDKINKKHIFTEKKVATSQKIQLNKNKKTTTSKKTQNKINKNIPNTLDISKKIHNVLNDIINKKNNSIIQQELLVDKNITSNKNTSTIKYDDEINSYKMLINKSISDKFYDYSKYKGKTCSLCVKISKEGYIIHIAPMNGDYDLCKAAIAATKLAKIPKPPNVRIFNIFKDITLKFTP